MTFDPFKIDLQDVSNNVKWGGVEYLDWICLVLGEDQWRTLSWGSVIFLKKDSVEQK